MDNYYKAYREAVQRGQDAPESNRRDQELAAQALRARLDIPPHLADYLGGLEVKIELLQAKIEQLQAKIEEGG